MTRTLTLHQPHASLVAVGAKTIETRGWKAPDAAIGERLLIHAGKRAPEDGLTLAGWTVTPGANSPWLMIPPRAGMQVTVLPLGAIVASCVLTDCVPTEEVAFCKGDYLRAEGVRWDRSQLSGALYVVAEEEAFGDYSDNRWAWLLSDIKPTTERCPRCWNQFEGRMPGHVYGSNWDFVPCQTCNGDGKTDPIPATGKQGLWRWEPHAASTAARD